MHWSQRGAHLLLQVRAQVLNNELRETFWRWYPGMRAETETAVKQGRDPPAMPALSAVSSTTPPVLSEFSISTSPKFFLSVSVKAVEC